MKFTVDRQQFLKAITTVDGIIPSREIRSVYSNVLIEADKGNAVLTTTDLEIGLKTSIPIQMDKKGSTTVPAKKLTQVIGAMDGDSIEISVDDDKINIYAPQARTKPKVHLVTSPASDYPASTSAPESSFVSFPAAVLREMITKTFYAMAQDDSRYVFNGLYLKVVKNTLIIVATDGRRLSKIERELPNALPFKEGIILPAKAVKELVRLLDASEEAALAFDEKEKRVHIRVGRVDLVCKLIDGNFPDYEQVIPKKLDHKIKINRIELEKAMRQAASVAIEPARQVRMSFTSGNVGFQASTPDLGGSESSLDCEYGGPEMVIGFNSVYIMDVLKVLASDDVQLGFSSPSSPSVVSDPADPDFLAVVMPMKI
ncbi:MAG: DNA polymerase III subunit beta [Spirochaetia bacterium]|nr:DNA polymerase III subunit beta [Spirochaetia bacterium]